MIKTATKTLLLSTAIILLTGIVALAQTHDLGSGKWKLTEALGKPVTNSTAFIQFGDDVSRFTGNTGCNQMFGSVLISGSNRIRFSAIGMTKRACKLMAGNVGESVFVKALNDTVRYRKTVNRLELMDRRGRIVLKFKLEAGAGTDQLNAKKWMLESIGQRRTLVAIKNVSIVFDKQKGSAGGNTGCNVFGGSYEAGGSSLKITEVISTMRACLENGKMQIERDFLDGLRNTTRYEIRDSRLMLYGDSRLLLTFRGVNK